MSLEPGVPSNLVICLTMLLLNQQAKFRLQLRHNSIQRKKLGLPRNNRTKMPLLNLKSRMPRKPVLRLEVHSSRVLMALSGPSQMPLPRDRLVARYLRRLKNLPKLTTMNVLKKTK
jgi:hypothetical protein